MDRNEAILRELNLYPQWVQRNMPAPVVAEQYVPIVAVQRAHEVPADVVPTAINVSTPIFPNPSPINPDNPSGPESAVGASSLAKDFASKLAPTIGEASNGQSGINVRGELSELGWTELKQQVRDCTACKLRAGCTQTVFGVGDEQADWLFVGEGPGADEDALGEPFVGQAGKLLDSMLIAIKLKRGNKVYIANIVKCRPPGNRAPESDEISACMPYLQRQIELIQPKIIVALGKVASNALLREGDAESIGHPSAPPLRGLRKEATLASLRGKLHDYRGIPLIVTYHPAYLLRSPSEKAKAWQDLCLAVKTIQGGA
jgi:uracil-DNA glycosylase family 4